MNNETPIYSEQSLIHAKNRMVIGIAVLFCLALFALTLYKWFVHSIRQPMELFIYIMFSFVLIERAQAKYTCELYDDRISFTKHGLLGTKKYDVPYKYIFGIYGYETKLLHVIKFRRSYRLNSALDNRRVWVMAYHAPIKGDKMENRRIYFKASEKLLNLLAEKLPNRVKVKEEQVVIDMLNAAKELEPK